MASEPAGKKIVKKGYQPAAGKKPLSEGYQPKPRPVQKVTPPPPPKPKKSS